MIQRFDLDQRVREWGLAEHVVEKDFALGWLLSGIGADPQLGRAWIFKGGTCLKKCFVETWRFSEDLDFTVVPGGPIAPDAVLPILRAILVRLRDASGIDFLAQEPRLKPLAAGEAAEGSVYYRGPRQTPSAARLKLDLTRLEEIVLAPVERAIHHAYPDSLPGRATVLCYAFEELFAEKIRALADRLRPRDLYDVVNLLRNADLAPSGASVKRVLARKCARKSLPVPTLASIGSSPGRPELASEWENMLGHQLPALPPLQALWDELPALFDWLEGRAAARLLEHAPRGEDDDRGWAAPSGVAVWNVSFALESIRFAAANRLCVELGYRSETRLIEPYSIRRTRTDDLLLYAVRSDHGELRAYRIDRIESARATQQTFRPRFRVELTASGPLDAPTTRR